jgi:Arc/MetJ-type ribon-helix-helix transcriptional regulator
MKLSVSLPESDVTVLDRYAAANHLSSRSAALHAAVSCLREEQLLEDYKASFREWGADPANAAWDGVVGDGLTDEAW